MWHLRLQGLVTFRSEIGTEGALAKDLGLEHSVDGEKHEDDGGHRGGSGLGIDFGLFESRDRDRDRAASRQPGQRAETRRGGLGFGFSGRMGREI